MQPTEVLQSESDVLQCQFHEWYPRFKGHTIRSRVLPLPEDFVSYLHEDGVYIPAALGGVVSQAPQAARGGAGDERMMPDGAHGVWDAERHTGGDTAQQGAAKEEEEEEEEEEDDDGDEARYVDGFFPELVREMEGAIEALGGAVFAKLNWSSPRDATWVACGETLRCTCVADVLLLLKSSDFVAHDLEHAFERCGERVSDATRPPQFYLALRKWSNLLPSREFRCFVCERELVAISQRDYTNFYEHLALPESRLSTVDTLTAFFVDTVRDRLGQLSSVVFDAYVDGSGRAWLVDLNPFGEGTDALLFNWCELAAKRNPGSEPGNVDYRVVDSAVNVRMADLSYYRMPKDLIDLSSADAIEKFAKLSSEQPELFGDGAVEQ